MARARLARSVNWVSKNEQSAPLLAAFWHPRTKRLEAGAASYPRYPCREVWKGYQLFCIWAATASSFKVYGRVRCEFSGLFVPG
eukprot:scaffold29315_cov35-Tisochrysis_lutea.AAC.6